MSKRSLVHKPYQKLKGFFCEKGLTYGHVGCLLGVTATTISQKMNGYSDFYLSEFQKIKDTYGATNDLFLP